MAKTSDGGRGDPPDLSNANTTTAILSTYPAAVRSPENDQVSTKIDQVMTNPSTTCPPVYSGRPAHPSVLNNNTTTSVLANTNGALSKSSSVVHGTPSSATNVFPAPQDDAYWTKVLTS